MRSRLSFEADSPGLFCLYFSVIVNRSHGLVMQDCCEDTYQSVSALHYGLWLPNDSMAVVVILLPCMHACMCACTSLPLARWSAVFTFLVTQNLVHFLLCVCRILCDWRPLPQESCGCASVAVRAARQYCRLCGISARNGSPHTSHWGLEGLIGFSLADVCPSLLSSRLTFAGFTLPLW